jgi:hypothetical protein
MAVHQNIKEEEKELKGKIKISKLIRHIPLVNALDAGGPINN